MNRYSINSAESMNTEILHKYISGNASEAEEQQVVAWMNDDPAHVAEYMRQRRLYEASLWQSESGQEPEQSGRRKHLTLWTLVREVGRMAAMLALCVMGTYYWNHLRHADETPAFQTIYVPAGQRSELLLADGTKVWLNSRSTLKFPAAFSGKQRLVQLDGEGYFEVSKDAKHPFLVETARCNVRVLGTSFDVKAYATDSVWETALMEGRVELYLPGKEGAELTLEPNERAVLRGNRLVKGQIREADQYRWREGLICFNNVTVREMFEKMKLYYGVEIRVNNSRILDHRFTGKFRINDGVEHLLRVLKLKHRFTYQRNSENNIIEIN